MFPLNKAEESAHVWPPEVVVGSQPSEQAPSEQPLEVILADVLKGQSHENLLFSQLKIALLLNKGRAYG